MRPLHGQWPTGANDTQAKPLHSPTGKAKNAADGRSPIQSSSSPGKAGQR